MTQIIKYKGKIDNVELIPQMVDALIDFAKASGWLYFIDEEENFRGVIIDIYRTTDALPFFFNEKGEIISSATYFYKNFELEKIFFVKEAVINDKKLYENNFTTIIKLLEFIKSKYVSNLVVKDKCNYWKTKNKNIVSDYFYKTSINAKESFKISDDMKLPDDAITFVNEKAVKETLKNHKWPTKDEIKWMNSNEGLLNMYDEDAIITRLGKDNIIHLDEPDIKEIKHRINIYKEESITPTNCPLCELNYREHADIVYQCMDFCPDCDKKENCKYYNSDLEKTWGDIEDGA